MTARALAVSFLIVAAMFGVLGYHLRGLADEVADQRARLDVIEAGARETRR